MHIHLELSDMFKRPQYELHEWPHGFQRLEEGAIVHIRHSKRESGCILEGSKYAPISLLRVHVCSNQIQEIGRVPSRQAILMQPPSALMSQ